LVENLMFKIVIEIYTHIHIYNKYEVVQIYIRVRDPDTLTETTSIMKT